MDDKKYSDLWIRFREQSARKAMEAVSTDVMDHYNQILQDMAILEAEIMLEDRKCVT